MPYSVWNESIKCLWRYYWDLYDRGEHALALELKQHIVAATQVAKIGWAKPKKLDPKKI